MAQGIQEPEHVWLVMMKAMRALTRYAAAGIEETGLGLSDFGILEALLHKGPLPVNTMGPIVDLTPVETFRTRGLPPQYEFEPLLTARAR